MEPQFAPVHDAFFADFEQELGAAVAVYQRGKLVVALAAGLALAPQKQHTRETHCNRFFPPPKE